VVLPGVPCAEPSLGDHAAARSIPRQARRGACLNASALAASPRTHLLWRRRRAGQGRTARKRRLIVLRKGRERLRKAVAERRRARCKHVAWVRCRPVFAGGKTLKFKSPDWRGYVCQWEGLKASRGAGRCRPGWHPSCAARTPRFTAPAKAQSPKSNAMNILFLFRRIFRCPR
jgi:hypothetical protein